MSITFTNPSPPAVSTSPFPYPFDKLQPQFIVTVVDQTGLFEVLAETDQGQWLLRALNDDKLRIMTVDARDTRGFDLPIYHCFASRTRREIVVLVNGDEYDVTQDEDADGATELFQAAHAVELAEFCRLVIDAGFTEIELSNGYDAWEGAVSDLLAECQEFIQQRALSDGRNRQPHPTEPTPLSGIVGVILEGRRLTDAEVRACLAKGDEWAARRRAEGVETSGPNAGSLSSAVQAVR